MVYRKEYWSGIANEIKRIYLRKKRFNAQKTKNKHVKHEI